MLTKIYILFKIKKPNESVWSDKKIKELVMQKESKKAFLPAEAAIIVCSADVIVTSDGIETPDWNLEELL